MTKRVTVSLPDDVADYLDGVSNASAAVTRALREHMRLAETTLAMQRAAGFNPRPGQGLLPPPFTDEERAEIARRYEALQNGTWRNDQTAAA
jgi:hypothetical protein